MGIQFDLETANWLAYVLEPNAPVPSIGGADAQFVRLRAFLYTLSDRFYSSPSREALLSQGVKRALQEVTDAGGPSSKAIAGAIEELRRHFQRRPWTALILPSGDDPEVDEYLCSAAESATERSVYTTLLAISLVATRLRRRSTCSYRHARSAQTHLRSAGSVRGGARRLYPLCI